MARAQQMDQQANAIAIQYGNNSEQSTTYAIGKLTWPDGTEGILEAGVTNSITRKPDMFNGGVSTFSSTMVFYTTVIRFPPQHLLFKQVGFPIRKSKTITFVCNLS